MSITSIDHIRNFFESIVPLTDEEYDAIQSILSYKKLRRKEYFLKQGQVCRHLGLIIKGYVRLFYLVDGEEVTKDFNFENWICGSYASFSTKQPSRFNIIAMEDCELYLIGREDLYRLFDLYPNIQKMGRLQIEKMFIYKELRESSFLLDSAEERYRNLAEQYPGILQRVPLKYLAYYMGITPETISRIRAGKI